MNYWLSRNLKTQYALTSKSIKETNEQLKKYYSKSMSKIIGQFEETYNKLLSSIAEGNEPTPADLYRLDKYWQMQGQLQQELTKLGDKQAKFLSNQFVNQFLAIYEAIAIEGQTEFATIDAAVAYQMINQIWCADGDSWSNRIWKNTELLQQELNEGLIACVVTGKKTTELKNILQERFDVSYNRADALVRTEMAHIQTQAAEKRYTDYGIKEVEVWATKDERRYEICGKLHQKRYKVGSMMPIPAHPRCRCAIIPVIE